MNPLEEAAFERAMKKVQWLREAKAHDLARRDRAEWEFFVHFVCQNSVLQPEAEYFTIHLS